MPKWVNSATLDGGLNAIKTGAVRMLLIKAYAAGDSYATVFGNRVAEATMANADFTLGSSGNNRTLTSAAKSGATASANSGAGPDLHIAFTDGSSTVLWVTDETSNVTVNSGDTVNFPSLVYTANQPT